VSNNLCIIKRKIYAKYDIPEITGVYTTGGWAEETHKRKHTQNIALKIYDKGKNNL